VQRDVDLVNLHLRRTLPVQLPLAGCKHPCQLAVLVDQAGFAVRQFHNVEVLFQSRPRLLHEEVNARVLKLRHRQRPEGFEPSCDRLEGGCLILQAADARNGANRILKFRAESSPHAHTCLKSFSPQDSHPHIHTQPTSRVGRAGRSSHLRNDRATCDARVRTLDQFHVAKQRPGRTGGTGGACAEHTNRSRASPRGRDTVGVVLPGLRRSQAARAPWGARPACAFGAKSPKGGYLSRLPAIGGQPNAMRFDSHGALCRAVPWIERIFIPLNAADGRN
jgi:hypothetical protein